MNLYEYFKTHQFRLYHDDLTLILEQMNCEPEKYSKAERMEVWEARNGARDEDTNKITWSGGTKNAEDRLDRGEMIQAMNTGTKYPYHSTRRA
mgnify:FL=1